MTEIASSGNLLGVSIRNGEGASVLGNLFVTLACTSDNTVYRELRYDPRGERYLFPRLPDGEYSCTVTAAGYEDETQTLHLDRGPAQLDIRLRRRRPRAPLVLLLDDQRNAAEELASEVWRNPNAVLSGNPSLDTRLFVAFLHDPGVVDTLVAPLDALDVPSDLVPYLEMQIASTWTFLVGVTAAQELIRQVAHSRARLYATTRSVFRNGAICEISGRLPERDLHDGVLEVVRALDSQALLEILPFLMRSAHPERIPIAYFVQAASDLFRAHLPPRVARRRDAPAPIPPVPALDSDTAPFFGDPDVSITTASAQSPMLAALARGAAWALHQTGDPR